MENKTDWHYGKKTRPLLTKPKKRRGNINVNKAVKKNKVENQIDEINPCTSFSTPNVQNNLLNYYNPNISISSMATTENNSSWDNLEGRRIVNIKYVFEKIQSIKHDGFDCSFRNLQFTKEIRLGFFSSFYFKCKICGLEEIIKSEELNDNNINVNMAMVSSIVNTGQGYSQLEEFSATLNMPNMSNKLYQDFHKSIYKHLNDLAWNEMLTAGKEEAKLALEKGEVDHLGRPKIAVVADGAWSKRSYKTKYNALPGVACIIGARTKKVLFFGLRNKIYCSIYQLSENREDVVHEHICFKNWNTASTAMEADIIVEGFKQSLIMHNIIYSVIAINWVDV